MPPKHSTPATGGSSKGVTPSQLLPRNIVGWFPSGPPTFRELPWSVVDEAFLDKRHQRRLVSYRSHVRRPEGELTHAPSPGEVVVFAEEYKYELRFPCSAFLQDVLGLFKLKIQHLSPNVVVWLAASEWAF